MRLTILGKSPSWQDAGGACSGYMIEEDGVCVVIDCGNGVFSKLRRFRDYTRVDAVVISHLHADHFLDLVPFSYALTYAPRQQPVPVDRWPGVDCPACPRLITPRGSRETYRRVVGAWGNDDLIENAFALEEYEPSACPRVGPLKFSFQSVPHFTETFAIRVESESGDGQARVRRRQPPHRRPDPLRPGLRPAARGGDPSATGAQRRARPHDTARGGRARPPGRRRPGGAHAHLRRARRAVGAQ